MPSHNPKPKFSQSKRYASSNEEEAEADKSIHLEAIERSRASLADLGRSLNARDASYASDDDYDGGGDGDGGGGGFDFGGGGDDDDDFGDLHDGDHRFSSSSFQAGRTSFSSLGGNNNGTNGSNGTPNKAGGADNTRPPSFLQSQPVAFSQATVLLDAIASGNISTMESTNHYEYFNSQALANLSSGNLWAGAEHWKKIGRRKTNGGTGTGTGSNSQDDTVTGGKTPANNKKGRKGKTKALSSISSGRVAVLLNKPIDNLDELLLKKPSAPKKKGRSKADPLQLTKAMKTKYGKNDNLLPMDAGIDVKEFTTLFGRPKTNLMDLAKAKRDAALLAGAGTNTRSTKVVGFAGVETWGEHGGDNDSYGDNDDGAGFNFGGGDDDNDYGNNDNPNEFVVPELDDVRKVNKIKIGYAKIAKKVDVKRLKRDLWIELEHTFANNAINNNNNEEEEAKNQDDDDALSTASTVSDPDPVLAGTSDGDENENNTDEDAAAKTTATATTATTLSFQDTVRDMQMNESQPDVTLPFYFICILHLCNEKGLALESSGLDDFIIHSS
jgi:condensin complex subunit 2